MKKDRHIKILTFFILVSILMCLSYFVRDFVIARYNHFDLSVFTIDFVKNTGAAFSLFQTHTKVLVVISVLILAAILYLIIKNLEHLKYSDLILYSFPIAGVFCNLLERILDGYVTDYIRMNHIAFPIFNLSDVFINVGAFMIICNILFNNERQKRNQQ